jgi:hypothetical protein
LEIERAVDLISAFLGCESNAHYRPEYSIEKQKGVDCGRKNNSSVNNNRKKEKISLLFSLLYQQL